MGAAWYWGQSLSLQGLAGEFLDRDAEEGHEEEEQGAAHHCLAQDNFPPSYEEAVAEAVSSQVEEIDV